MKRSAPIFIEELQPCENLKNVFREGLRRITKLNRMHYAFGDKEIGETYAQYIARVASVHPTLISHWISGKRSPNQDELYKIIQALYSLFLYEYSDIGQGNELQNWLQDLMDVVWSAAEPNDVRQRNRLEEIIQRHFPSKTSPVFPEGLWPTATKDEIVPRQLLVDFYTSKLLSVKDNKFTLSRMVLYGPPGVGKSFLARMIVDRVQYFFLGGILYADLQYGKISVKTVLADWARILGIYPNGSEKVLSDRITTFINDQKGRWLIIVDNVDSANKIKPLCIGSTCMLVTSQEDLEIPEPSITSNSFCVRSFTPDEAVELYLRKIGVANWNKTNDPQKVHQIHDLTEGNPLALAITASIARYLPFGINGVIERLEERRSTNRMFRTANSKITPSPKAILDAVSIAIALMDSHGKNMFTVMSFLAPGVKLPAEIIENWLERRIGEQNAVTASEYAFNPLWFNYEMGLNQLQRFGLLESFILHPELIYLRIHRIAAIICAYQTNDEHGIIIKITAIREVLDSIVALQINNVVRSENTQTVINHLKIIWHHLEETKTYLPLLSAKSNEELRFPVPRTVAKKGFLINGGQVAYQLFGSNQVITWADEVLKENHSFDSESLVFLASMVIEGESSIFLRRIITKYIREAGKYYRNGMANHLNLELFLLWAKLHKKGTVTQEDLLDVMKNAALPVGNKEELSLFANYFYFSSVIAINQTNSFDALENLSNVLFVANATTQRFGDSLNNVPFPIIISVKNTISQLIEISIRAGCFDDAYSLALESSRFMLSYPWIWQLDHLFLIGLITLERADLEEVAVFIKRLKQAEKQYQEPNIRSTVLENLVEAEPLSIRKVARSLRKNGWVEWANYCECYAMNLDGHCSYFDKPDLILPKPLLFSIQTELKIWQDRINLPPISHFLSLEISSTLPQPVTTTYKLD